VAHVAHVGYMRSIVTGKPEGKRTLERLRHMWEDNSRMWRFGLDSSGSV